MRSRRKIGIHAENGFTLLEGMLAVIIIGMLAVIAIPKLASTNRRLAEITAQHIVGDMRYARGLAITNAKKYVVQFVTGGIMDTEYSAYGVYLDNGSGQPEGAAIKYREIPRDKIDCIDSGGGAGALESNPLIFTGLGSIENYNGSIIQTVGGVKTLTIGVVRATGMVSFD